MNRSPYRTRFSPSRRTIASAAPSDALLVALTRRRWAHSLARQRRLEHITIALAVIAAAVSLWSLWLLIAP